MKTIRKQILIGMTALGLGLGSLTVHAGADVNKDGRAEQRVERMKERMEKRTEELRAKLNLTAEQQPAWDAYIAAMKPAERPARPARGEMEKLTAPERMDRMHKMMQHAEQQMAKRAAATRDFYAVLTPEQRKVFDESFRKKHGPHHGKGPHGKGRGDK